MRRRRRLITCSTPDSLGERKTRISRRNYALRPAARDLKSAEDKDVRNLVIETNSILMATTRWQDAIVSETMTMRVGSGFLGWGIFARVSPTYGYRCVRNLAKITYEHSPALKRRLRASVRLH